MKEQYELNTRENHAHTRVYFETGCLCVKAGRLDKIDPSTSDREVIQYYESNCKCSRNYPNENNGGVSQ